MGTARARIRRRQLAAILLIVCVVTPVFNVTTNRATLGSAIQGLLDGLTITLLVGGYLMFVRDGWLRPWFRRLGFWRDLALNSAIVLALQIVFVGDILNTAARLEEYAKRSGLDLVVSGALLEQLALPPGVEATRRGELALRGKEAPIDAYGLSGAHA